ncbi:hypothetical protein FRC12_014536, partial [Ceratobasidium sp. 428]
MKRRRKGLVTVDSDSDESDGVTVIGRRRVETAAGATQRSWLTPSIQSVTFAQLDAMQKRDSDRDRKLMKETMTPAQQEDFATFQAALSGDTIAPDLPSANFDFLRDEGIEPGEDDYDDDEYAADEAAAGEDLGLKPGNKEWEERRQGEHAAWVNQLPTLCDAYLAFRSKTLPTRESPDEESITKVRCIDMDSESVKVFPMDSSTQSSVNEILVQHGYIGCSPLQPKLAISLGLVELFANVMRRGPSVSVQTLAKASCDSRNVPYTAYFRKQFTAALDAFNLIEREVQRRLDHALGRDEDFTIKNKCPACTFKLANEPKLKYSMLATCDGNDSLKRCANAGTADHRSFQSDYYISPAEVDKYQYEVSSRCKGKSKTTDKDDKDDGSSVCEKRWKNAKLHSRGDSDKPKVVFEETGVFASTCRHGFVLTMCDMIQSGE